MHTVPQSSSQTPIRVALIANSETPGGAESYLYRLYEGLSEQGLVEVTLIGQLPDWPKALKSLPVGIAPKLTRRERILPQIRGVVANAFAVRRELRAAPFDLVHMQYFREKLVLPTYFSRGLPVLWTEHGPIPPNFPRIGMPLLKRQGRRATIIAVSEAVRDSLTERGLESEVVWNPLPTESSDQLCRRTGQPSDYVLYAGRIHKNKRIELILAAARMNPAIRFKVAGDGPELSRLRSESPSNVEFLGHMTDLSEVMARSLAVVVTSGQAAREGSPMIVLEARKAGVPVLMASDCHAAEEARGLGARIYNPAPEELASEIARLGGKLQVHPLTAEQEDLRGEERWLSETFRIMSGLVR